MDIELLSKMIAELVPEHPEVGLPGLGTFVSEFVPASFTDRGYTITPPYKRVTFVPGKASDNSLVELYARSNGISEDQSRATLTAFLEDIKKVLLDRKIVVFPGLGRLRATRQNNIFFITDESLNIYPEGFGLEAVSLKNHEETPAEVHHVVESLAGIMVAPTEEFVEPSGEAQQPAPLIPADERLEFADEPAAENRLEAVDEEGREQKEAKMQHPPVEKQGGASKKAKNAAARREERKAKRQAAKEAKAAAKAERAAARAAAKADKAAAKVARREAAAAAKAEKAAAKASSRQAREDARATAKADRAAAKVAAKEARAAARTARKPAPKWIWVTPLVILAVAALAAAVFFILVYAAPDFLDSLLYTPEELRIINY